MLEKLLKRLTHRLDRQNIPYMIIGGQAVLLYGRPRLTRDIDITLGIDVDDYTKIESLCRTLNLKMLVEDPESFAIDTRVPLLAPIPAAVIHQDDDFFENLCGEAFFKHLAGFQHARAVCQMRHHDMLILHPLQ